MLSKKDYLSFLSVKPMKLIFINEMIMNDINILVGIEDLSNPLRLQQMQVALATKHRAKSGPR